MNETRATFTRGSSFSSVNCLNLCDMKIVMLGGCGVGKTSITQQYIRGSFNRDYEPSITSHEFKPNVTIRERRVSLEIIDTQGMDHNDIMLDQYIHMGDAFGLVTSGGPPHSLSRLIERVQAIKKDVPLVVIANDTGQGGHNHKELNKLCIKYNVTCKYTFKDLKDQNTIRGIFDPLFLTHQERSQPSLVEETPCCSIF